MIGWDIKSLCIDPNLPCAEHMGTSTLFARSMSSTGYPSQIRSRVLAKITVLSAVANAWQDFLSSGLCKYIRKM
jgi:hypothetical protein